MLYYNKVIKGGESVTALMAMIDSDTDKELFCKMFEKYKSRVYSIAFRVLSGEALAEEAAQETFFRLAKNFSLLKKLEAPQRELYIFMTAKHTALNVHRNEKKHLACEPADEDIPDDESMNAYERADIRAALSALDFEDREVLYMHYVMQLDFKAVGRALGISAAAARKRAQYARTRFKKLLEGGELR